MYDANRGQYGSSNAAAFSNDLPRYDTPLSPDYSHDESSLKTRIENGTLSFENITDDDRGEFIREYKNNYVESKRLKDRAILNSRLFKVMTLIECYESINIVALNDNIQAYLKYLVALLANTSIEMSIADEERTKRIKNINEVQIEIANKIEIAKKRLDPTGKGVASLNINAQNYYVVQDLVHQVKAQWDFFPETLIKDLYVQTTDSFLRFSRAFTNLQRIVPDATWVQGDLHNYITTCGVWVSEWRDDRAQLEELLKGHESLELEYEVKNKDLYDLIKNKKEEAANQIGGKNCGVINAFAIWVAFNSDFKIPDLVTQSDLDGLKTEFKKFINKWVFGKPKKAEENPLLYCGDKGVEFSSEALFYSMAGNKPRVPGKYFVSSGKPILYGKETKYGLYHYADGGHTFIVFKDIDREWRSMDCYLGLIDYYRNNYTMIDGEYFLVNLD
jgi:hypothetical protein